jgi:hypothetical protein
MSLSDTTDNEYFRKLDRVFRNLTLLGLKRRIYRVRKVRSNSSAPEILDDVRHYRTTNAERANLC